nr:phage portal protein [Bacillus velezensis]
MSSHIKFFSLDGITGMGPLSSLKREIESQEFGKRLVTDFFRRGVNLSGIVNLKKGHLSPEAKDKIRNEFEKANSGGRNQQRIAVLSENEEFKQLEINTKVLEIVNNYTHSTKQIAKAFGLPAHKLGIEQVNTSLEQANLDYLTNTLSNYFTAIASELNFKMLAVSFKPAKRNFNSIRGGLGKRTRKQSEKTSLLYCKTVFSRSTMPWLSMVMSQYQTGTSDS